MAPEIDLVAIKVRAKSERAKSMYRAAPVPRSSFSLQPLIYLGLNFVAHHLGRSGLRSVAERPSVGANYWR